MTVIKTDGILYYTLVNIINYLIIILASLGINIFIEIYYGLEVVGVFNQTIASYLVITQIAVLGIHFSVLQKISSTNHDLINSQNISEIILSSMLCTLFTSLVCIFIGYSIAPFIEKLFNSILTKVMWIKIMPSVVFFSMNKSLLNAINGLKKFYLFIFLKSLRHVLLLFFVLMVCFLKMDEINLINAFFYTEIIIFVISLVVLKNYLKLFKIKEIFSKSLDHLFFGLKSGVNGTISELSIRLDIIVLGIFSSEKIVGIYSIVSLIYEKLSYLCLIFRDLFNPIIPEALLKNNIINIGKKYSYITFIIVLSFSLIVLSLFPIFKNYSENQIFNCGYEPLAILLIGLILSSGFQVFDMLLIQSNNPSFQTYFKGFTILSNLFFNFLLIPILGMNGAALATTISSIIYILILYLFSKRLLNINIFHVLSIKKNPIS